MTVRSVVVRLSAEVGQFVNGMTVAHQATNKVAAEVGLLGAGMTAFAALSVKRFADFDQAMSNVAATGDDARLSLDELRKSALDAGQRTVYSATEAAGAIEELSKAGLSAADIMSGALDGSLDLAAAGALDVADAAGFMSVALAQFNLSGDKASHVADLLAAGASKALGEVSDLGTALEQGGLVAHQTGLSLEETTAALAAFANQGLIGSDAGTSLKTMLQRLTPQSEQAAKKMDELGISAYDQGGKFIGLSAFAGNLAESLKGLTDEQRNSALATIFGSDAVRGASVLYSEGAAGIKKWESAVNDQGYAAQVASTRLDNLNGDLEQLSGAFDTALINMGEGANGPLRATVQGLTNVVNGFSEMGDTAQTTTLAIFGAGGLVLVGAAALAKLVTGIAETRAAMAAMGLTARKAAIGVGVLGLAVTAATLVMVNWGNAQAEARANTEDFLGTLDELGQKTDATLSSINSKLTDDSGGGFFDKYLFGKDTRSLADKAAEYGIAIQDLTGYVLGQGDAMERVKKISDDYADSHFDAGFFGESSVSKQQDFIKGLDSLSGSLSDAEKKSLQKAEADKQAGVASGEAAAATDDNTTAVQKLAAAEGSGAATTQDYVAALKDLVDQQAEAAGSALDARGAMRGLEQSIDDATKSIKDYADAQEKKYKKDGKSESAAKKLAQADIDAGKALDIHTQAGRDNQDALDGIAKAGEDVIKAQQANGESEQTLRKSMAKTRAAYVDAAEKMGLSKTKANELADSLNLIPDSVTTRVAVDTASAQAAVDAFIVGNASRKIHIAVGAGGSGGITKADGGRVSGPGTGTSDSIPAWLSNGEYVVNAASTAQHLSTLEAINAGRFASGGRVGWAKNKVSDARDDYNLAHDEYAAAKKADAAASKSKAKGDDKVAASRLARAEKSLDAAKTDLQDAKDAYGRIVEASRDLQVDVRRGDSREQVTSGLSGAYSVIDQLRDASRNPDLSSKSRKNLASTAKEAEAGLKKLYDQADKIDAKLASAADNVSRLADIKNSAASALSGAFGLGDTIVAGKAATEGTGGTEGSWKSVARTSTSGQTWNEQIWDPGTAGTKGTAATADSATAGGIVAAYKARADKIAAFVKKMEQLRKLGLSGPMLQEIYGLGTEQGTIIADALIKGGKGSISALNTQVGRIDSLSNAGGLDLTKAFDADATAKGFQAGGLAAAQGFQKGLESDLANNKKAVAKWAKTLEKELKKAWGIASPSKVTYGLARFLGKGTENGLIDSMPGVMAAAKRFSGVAVPSMSAGGASSSSGGSAGVAFDVAQHFYGPDPYATARASEARIRDSVYSGGIHRLTSGGVG